MPTLFKAIRRHASLLAVVVMVLTSLAACTTPSQPGDPAANKVTLSQQRIAMVSQAVLASADAAVAAYEASAPIPPDVRAKLAAARQVADAAVAQVAVADLRTLPTAITSAMDGINQLVGVVPQGKIQPPVLASIAALQVFVRTLVPLIQDQTPQAPVVITKAPDAGPPATPEVQSSPDATAPPPRT